MRRRAATPSDARRSGLCMGLFLGMFERPPLHGVVPRLESTPSPVDCMRLISNLQSRAHGGTAWGYFPHFAQCPPPDRMKSPACTRSCAIPALCMGLFLRFPAGPRAHRCSRISEFPSGSLCMGLFRDFSTPLPCPVDCMGLIFKFLHDPLLGPRSDRSAACTRPYVAAAERLRTLRSPMRHPRGATSAPRIDSDAHRGATHGKTDACHWDVKRKVIVMAGPSDQVRGQACAGHPPRHGRPCAGHPRLASIGA